MVTKHLSVAEARAGFADLIGSVYYSQEPVMVERKGKLMAVVISPEQYERYQQHVMERFEQAVDEFQRRNADTDPETVLSDVTNLVDEVREERYDRDQQPDSGDA
jgi:prevent-host-death family protein